MNIAIINNSIVITDSGEIKKGDKFIDRRHSYSNRIYTCDIGSTFNFVLTKKINHLTKLCERIVCIIPIQTCNKLKV